MTLPLEDPPNPRRAAILTVRCGHDRSLFGIRMEETGDASWLATWAFAIPPERAAREGYTETRLDGAFELAVGYPGCPGCGSPSFAKCGRCSGLGCWNGAQERWTCPHCGVADVLKGRITSLSSTED